MAEELDDTRFKSEVMNLLGRLINKANDHDQRFDSLEQRFDGLEGKVDGLTADMKIVKGQLNDLGVEFVKDHKRLESLETRVEVLEAR